jgi:Flp pilus assembly protein TadD
LRKFPDKVKKHWHKEMSESEYDRKMDISECSFKMGFGQGKGFLLDLHLPVKDHPWRAPMARNNSNNALGKGLRALIREKEDSPEKTKSDLESERHARNMEFYGSLVKKYISSRMEDDLLEEMLEDVRTHMGISLKEHRNLMNTLKRRENIKHLKGEDQERARTEIKEELAKIYQQIHGKEASRSDRNRFLKIERELEDGEKKRTIQLSNGKKKEKPKVAKVIRRRLMARNLDDRAGILENGKKDRRRGRLEWLEEDDEKAIKMTAPKKGLEDSDTPIKATAPLKGLDEERETIIAPSPKKGLEDAREILMMKAPARNLENGDLVIEAPPPKEEDTSSKPLEMPPSSVPAGPGPGFEIMKEMEAEEKSMKTAPEPEIPIDDETEEEEEIDEIEEEFGEEEDIVESQEEEEEYDDSLLSLKMLMEEENMEEASSMADRLLARSPDDVSILNEKGVILYNQGRIDEAIELYKNILELDPESVETLINYATLLSIRGEIDNSLECLDRAVKKDPYSEDAWNNKAVVFSRAGRLREALECLDEALRINEKTASTWMNAGIILEKMGEIEPAMECYKNLLELEPENEVAAKGMQYCRSVLNQ